MDAKKSSSNKVDWNRVARAFGTSLQSGMSVVSRCLNWFCARAIPWGRDHILTLAVLWMFPLGIAAYYWGTPEAEDSETPRHLQMGAEAESISEFEDDPYSDPTPLSSVIPDGPLAPEKPGGNQFPSERDPDSVAVPQPLPISAQDPEVLIPRKNRAPLPTWNPHVSADYRIDEPEGDCVWLTGTIETFDPPRRIQNASRVHELTRPHPD